MSVSGDLACRFIGPSGDCELARILVLDGHSAAALATTRSAGRAGHWVAVGGNRGLFAAAKLSRFSSSAFDHPSSTGEAGPFIDAMVEFIRTNKIDLLVPVTDWTLQPVSQQRERFTGLCRVALPSPAALDAVSDKYRTIRLAESLGIAVPRTLLLASAADLAKCQGSRFPVVVKDRFSVRWIGGKAVFGSVAYAYSAAELEKLVRERLRPAGDVLVQEFAAGVGIGFSCFVAQGKTYLPFEWQRIREVDPRGSGSSARKSIPLEPALVAASERLITAVGFEGLAMVEYKRTKDGRLVLMEINGRPWGSIGLPIACGIDYPRYLIEWCLRGELPPETVAYRENLLCRRAVGELTYLSALRAGTPAHWPIPYPNFWVSLAEMAVLWHPNMCYDDIWLSDPRPGVAAIKNWFASRSRKKSRRH
jgi:predicted ATP-grasp superfamily ATP-dependent carboligase